jgi:D-alanine-D-alanine ligase
LKFPLFVKPAREGTGMGVDLKAIVNNETELRERAQYIINVYQQPALVETFLPGREFTVGVLGRADSKEILAPPRMVRKGRLSPLPRPRTGHEPLGDALGL